MTLRTDFIARGIAVLWAGFWLFFYIAEPGKPHLRVMLAWVGVGLLFLGVALAAWRWEFTGGLLLLVAGLVTGVVYAIWWPPRLSVAIQIFTEIAFVVPPVVAGLLFLLHHRGLSGHPVPPLSTPGR
jgi:Na+/proline symporter